MGAWQRAGIPGLVAVDGRPAHGALINPWQPQLIRATMYIMLPQMILPKAKVAHELEPAIRQANNLVQDQTDSTRVLRDGYESWKRRNELSLEAAFKMEGFLPSGPKTDYLNFATLNYPFQIPKSDINLSTDALREDIEVKRNRLEILLGNLDLYPEAESGTSQSVSDIKNRIFVIHGRDEISRLRLVDVLRKATDAEPVVLMEQPNGGQTIIEKLEENLGHTAGFAVILLTGDDEGSLKGGDPQASGSSECDLGAGVRHGSPRATKCNPTSRPGRRNPQRHKWSRLLSTRQRRVEASSSERPKDGRFRRPSRKIMIRVTRCLAKMGPESTQTGLAARILVIPGVGPVGTEPTTHGLSVPPLHPHCSPSSVVAASLPSPAPDPRPSDSMTCRSARSAVQSFVGSGCQM